MEKDVFQKVLDGELPGKFLYQDELVSVLLDIAPINPGQAVVIPKKYYRTLSETPNDVAAALITAARNVGNAQMKQLNADGYNIIINSESAAGQEIFRTHFNVIPRFTGDGLRHDWPQKTYTNDAEREAVGEKLRTELSKH